jgi:hypothetical protein
VSNIRTSGYQEARMQDIRKSEYQEKLIAGFEKFGYGK